MKFSSNILALVSFASLALAAPPPSGPSPGQKLIHPNGNTAKCLAAASNTNGGAVILQDCPTGPKAPSPEQLWTPTSSGTLQIFGNKCLDDTNGVTTNGQKMQIYTCNTGNKNQKWAATSSGSIGLTGTNKCLDNTDGKTSNGNPAQIWSCTGGKNQKWTLTDATKPPAKGMLIQPGKSSSSCLTATNNANNAAVVIKPCDKSSSQAWSVTGGTVQIYGNKCLDVPNGSTTSGVKMQIYTCYPGNTNQKFTTTSSKQIQWTNKGECLDLTDGKTSFGTPAQMWKCANGNTNQVWNVVSL